jgi:hypothetical protein
MIRLPDRTRVPAQGLGAGLRTARHDAGREEPDAPLLLELDDPMRLDRSDMPPLTARHGGKLERPMRRDLIARVRAEIAAGRYETSHRLAVAAERMVDDLERI